MVEAASKNELATAEGELTKAEGELAKAEGELAKAKGKLETAKTKLAKAEGKLAEAKTDDETKRANKNYDLALDGVETAQQGVKRTEKAATVLQDLVNSLIDPRAFLQTLTLPNPVFNGFILVETTTAALASQKLVCNTSKGWVELVTKLLRAERALRYFEARDGADAVKYLFLDSPVFEEYRHGQPVEMQLFWTFFSWMFEQTVPASEAKANQAAADLSPSEKPKDKPEKTTNRFLGGMVEQFRDFLKHQYGEVVDIQESASKYQLADADFPWEQPQVLLADAFGIEFKAPSSDSGSGMTLEIDQIIKASVPAWGSKGISPPASPFLSMSRGLKGEVVIGSENKKTQSGEPLPPPSSIVITEKKDPPPSITFKQCLPKLFAFFALRKFLPYPRKVV